MQHHQVSEILVVVNICTNTITITITIIFATTPGVRPFPEIGISNKSFEHMDKRKSLLNLAERFWNSGKIGWGKPVTF